MKRTSPPFVRTKVRGASHLLLIGAIALVVIHLSRAASVADEPSYARWKNGPPSDPRYFPIGVWLQNPGNAGRYRRAGINLYVGLYRGPTTNQLAMLEKAGMKVICGQNRGLEFKDNSTIIGWMHGDEPDNAQSLGQGKGYGPPILPQKIVADYERLRSADPTRPVLLNLGQGVAWDNYIGRGVRRNHPEDYPEYLIGCDIASFDIYPAVHDNPSVAGKLEFVPLGVQRLREWTRQEKPVWNCIECTHISNTNRKASPEQVRAEVWMSLIQGSRGLIYFVHQFKPTFKEAALLDDPEMLGTVTALNKQIAELAPVLNSQTISNGVRTRTSGEAPIATLLKRLDGSTYLFAALLTNAPARLTFSLSNMTGTAEVDVLGESRQVEAIRGVFADDFKGYGVHLYRVATKK